MSVEITTYKEREIVTASFSMEFQEKMEDTLAQIVEVVTPYEMRKEKYLFLLDVTNVPMTKDFAGKLMQVAKEHAQLVDKSAIVGVTGIKRLFFETYLLFGNSRMQAFSGRDEAFGYLVGEA